MSHLKQLTVLSVITMFCSYSGLHASATTGAEVFPEAVSHQPRLPSGETKPKALHVEANSLGGGLLAGTNNEESATVTCPGTASCTLVLSAMDQIGNCSGGGAWAISVLVDGNSVDGGPTQGQQPTSGFVIGNWQGVYLTTPGVHTVQLQTFVATNCTQGHWAVNSSS